MLQGKGAGHEGTNIKKEEGQERKNSDKGRPIGRS
jgi:hypothetical protein